MSRSPVMHQRMRHRRATVASAAVRRRRRRVGSLMAAAALLFAAVLVARSPLFAVADVRVEGVSGERAGEVRDAAAIEAGDNLLDVNLRAAAARVEGLAWVADAEARRVPPSAVAVSVRPRQPIAVTHVGPSAWLLDADGTVIAGGTRDDLPVIEAPHAQLPAVGDETDDPAVRNALAVHASLPPGVRGLVDRYDAETVAALRLQVVRPAGDAVWVRFGAADDVAAKARAIELLLAELELAEGGVLEGEAAEHLAGGAVELDVRAPNNPVVVPVSST